MSRLPDDVIEHLRDVATWPELPSDRYVIRKALGRGGMGSVYLAVDHQLERDVAIKVSNAPGADSGLDRRLRQESRVLARLEHPGIVPVHDAGILADGRWFYVMKFVRGQVLADHMSALAGEAAVVGLFERIVETVAFAHDAGIVHRDLKPSNIMVGRFGEVLVLDWGAAKILGASDARLAAREAEAPAAVAPGETAEGTRMGTPGFMAPEQHRGEAASAGPASDVFSLGALLFWMLTGRPVPESPDRIAADVSARPAPTSRRLRAIVGKCLAMDPADRYADAGALVADLARYRAGLSVSAHRESMLERAGRWFDRYRTFILLVAAYLIMRALFAWAQRG